jgi:hypothetical protein
MLEIMMISSLTILGAYSIWYFFKAQTYHPLSLDDLALMWKSHKHRTGCTASSIETLLLKNNEVVGYKCSCGTRYYQKRLITQRVRAFTKNKLVPTVTNKFTGLSELNSSLEQVGLNYSHIKQI